VSKDKTIGAIKGYYILPVGEIGEDWKKVVLVNRLLRLGCDVYRNTSPLDNYPAGSFFITFGGLPISESKAGAYLEKQAKELIASLAKEPPFKL